MNIDELSKQYFTTKSIQEQIRFVIRMAQEQPDLMISAFQYTSPIGIDIAEGYDPIHMLINTALSRQTKLSDDAKDIVNDLDTLFRKIPPLTEPLVVYRGKKYDVIDNVDPTFPSTSLFEEVAIDFTDKMNRCCLLKITVSPGSKILPLHGFSVTRDEYEILLDRGGTFIVTGSEIRDKMKVIYVSYLPRNETMDKIVDPKNLDESQLIESVVKYFIGRKKKPYRSLIKQLAEKEGFSLSDKAITTIQIRLNFDYQNYDLIS